MPLASARHGQPEPRARRRPLETEIALGDRVGVCLQLALLVDHPGAARRARLSYARAALADFAVTVVIGRPSGVSLLGRLRCIQRDTRAGSVEMMISS